MFPGTILHHRLGSIAVCAISLLAAGCVTTTSTKLRLPQPAPATEVRDAVRQGRYRLVEVSSELAQRNLLEQIIDVSIPDAATANVADALRHALEHTGFVLCETSGAASSPFSRMPLPAPHHHLGPIKLVDALRVLVGPAWVLQVEEAERHICFAPSAERPDSAPPLASGVSSDRVAPATGISPHNADAPTTCSGEFGPRTRVESDPPFTPLRIERSDSDYTLYVASPCGRSTIAARVLRVDDIEGSWLLARLNQNEAEFVVSGVPQRIILR